MIKFKSIYYRNFLSVGDSGLRFNLDRTKKTLIYGKNGEGKSTILDALTFALYGKSYRGINKPQLVNYINKRDCVVELEFYTNGNNYKVVRGIAPNFFIIECNGAVVDQEADVDDHQDWFEQNVIKMNINTFKQVSVLGAADYTPFMKLPAAKRREVSEQLLDVAVFSAMNKILKDRWDVINNEINRVETVKTICEGNLARIERMTLENIAEKERALAVCSQQALTLISNRSALQTKITSITIEDTASAESMRRMAQDRFTEINLRVGEIAGRLSFFETANECPECAQGISDDHKHTTIHNLKTERQSLIDERDEGVRMTLNEMDKVLLRASANARLKSDLNMDLIRVNTQIESLKSNAQRLKTEIDASKGKDGALESEHLKQATEQLVEAKEQLAKLGVQKAVADAAAKMLKDTGIKASIVKQYVPVINKLINKYLNAFNFFVRFEFNENFEETIAGGSIKEYSYHSFSMGQRMRVDLAMLFAWREIARQRSKVDTNLLFFDEILDSSLDSEGADTLLAILDKLLSGMSVFIISHRQAFVDKIESSMKIEMINGFTRIASET